MTPYVRRLTLLGSAASAAMMIASAASAQNAAPLTEAPAGAGGDAAALDTIVVTGTRLQASGFTTPVPVTVTSAAKIQERAKVNIADSLNELPSFQPTQGPTQAQKNASSTQGGSTLDLRGLGGGRTLVLLDGKRYITPDVSGIPTNLIDRVEVVTGGASAQYGSDAVAGVINFILNDRLEGIKAGAQYGFSQHGDNLEPAVNFAVGHSFADGKIHVIAGADWSKNEGVSSQYDRDWGLQEYNVIGLGSARGNLPANLLTPYGQYANMTTGGIINKGPLAGTAFGAGGSTYQFNYGSIVGANNNNMVGGLNNNYGLTPTSQQRIEQPTSRLSTLMRATFDVTPDTSVYIEGSYAQNRVDTSSSFSIRSSEIGEVPILASNPYLPAAVAAQVAATGSTVSVGGVNVPGFNLGRLWTDLGQWGAVDTNRTYRGVAGVKTNLWHDWKLDAFFQYMEWDQDNLLFPVNKARFFQAAYAVRDASGNIVCGPLSSNPYFLNQSAAARATLIANAAVGGGGACVPLNPFGPNNNKAAQSYIRQNYDQSVVTKQLSGSATISGSPFSTWAGPVSLAFGGEWRRDSNNNTGDSVAQNGGYYEFNATPLVGSQGVYEGFAEVGVPLLKDSPIGKSLNFDGAVRRTHYEYSGWVTTWKVGGNYEPTDWLRIRATESRDIKAPTVGNLFSVGGGALWPVVVQVTDPATGKVSSVNTSVQGASAGSTSVKPEVANTFTGGFVLSPRWGFLNGLRISADYFNITVDGLISSLTPPTVLQRYYAGQAQYAQYITFDPNAVGGIGRVVGTVTNQNQLKTDGVDLNIDYRVPLSDWNIPGQLSISTLVTWVDQLATFTTVGTSVSKANRVGGDVFGSQGGPVPRYRGTVTVNYNLGRFGSTVQVRGFSGFRFGTNLIGPGQAGYSPALSNSINDNSMPGTAYWSLQLRYDVLREGSRSLQVYAQADNLFDKDPPGGAIVMTQGGGIPYDLIGRTFKIGARFTM
jgi:outer membrane receptor protein involved in Fe transport